MRRATSAVVSVCGNGGANSGLFRRSRVLAMRFDKEAEKGKGGADATTGTSSTSLSSSTALPPTAAPGAVQYMDLPASMQPRQVPADFTPFPLPKYDKVMGFGPVRLSNIPDVEVTAQRMQQKQKQEQQQQVQLQAVPRLGQTSRPYAFAAPTDGYAMSAALLEEFMAGTEEETVADSVARPSSPEKTVVMTSTEKDVAAAAAAESARDDADDLGDGYRVTDDRFPVIDRIDCQRSLGDLLAQFQSRPAREARTATVLDLANSMPQRSNEELTRMLYELGALFTADGNGLQFLAARVVKFGLPYHAADELMKAFVHLVNRATETLVTEQPQRLASHPALFVQLLHFLAQIKIFEPNLWYSPNPNAPSNRADYSHPRGVNQKTAYQRTGEELYDYMTGIILDSSEEMATMHSSTSTSDRTSDGDGGTSPSLLALCTDEQLVDLLAGFGAVMPSGLPEGELANAVLDTLLDRWATAKGGVLTQESEVRLLERLYLLLSLFNIKQDNVLVALLGTSEGIRHLKTGTHRGTLTTQSTAEASQELLLHRGPDFFASLSREKRTDVQARAAELLVTSVRAAKAEGDATLVAALAESGFEFLLGLQDKAGAVATANALDLDGLLLRSVPEMNTVAERLAWERRAAHAGPQVMVLSKLQSRLDAANGEKVAERQQSNSSLSSSSATDADVTTPSYVTMVDGKRVHPIRTLLAELPHVNQMDSVFLVHSSITTSAVEALVSAVNRLQSGKDALVITTSCLKAITARAYYSRTTQERENAQRALAMLSYELEKGRAILVPASEELAVHDAGTYCDEDLMLWTLAAYFARELPLVRVGTLMSNRSRARNPQRHLKGEHSPLTMSMDLYRADTPLLQALSGKELRAATHHARLQRKVRDARSKLHDVNPARARFVYRRDKALFDKYHVTARNLAPGFSRGALASDLRGLGFYTPDHPQVPYRPLEQKIAKRLTAASAPLPWASTSSPTRVHPNSSSVNSAERNIKMAGMCYWRPA